MLVLIFFCRFAMASSGPELDLEFLTKMKDNVGVPKGIHTPMCFCSDNCKLVRCNVLGYAYRMRFFMCTNNVHDPIKPFNLNVRAKVKTYYISQLFIVIFVLLCVDMSLQKDFTSSL
jgi:hypothetical protein